MWIRNIHLQNFQKHSDLFIEFKDGINIIHGNSSTGKTCIKHAIEFLCQHDTFNGQRKVGTKTTSVKGLFNNGITVERIISASLNRYILTKDGKESVFDAVGKDAPDEIKEAIGIYPLEIDKEKIFLNSASQIALPFLFDRSPSFRMKLFNLLTGNDVLDKLFGQFNKDILRLKRGYKEETERFEERTNILKEKQIEKEKSEAIYERLKTRIENVKKLNEKYSKLLELKGLEEKNLCDLQEVKHLLSAIKFPEDKQLQQLRAKVDNFTVLFDIKNRREKVKAGLDRVSGQLTDFRVPTVNSVDITGKIQTLGNLTVMKEKLDKNQKMCYTLKEDIKIVEKLIVKCEIEHKKLHEKADICPTCKGEGVILK